MSASIKNSVALLNTISSYDESIEPIADRLDSCKVEITDISETLSDMLQKLDFDSRSADKIEERLEVVRNILRKYGGSFESLQRFYEEAVNEAQMLQTQPSASKNLKKRLKKRQKICLSVQKNCPRKDEKLRISLKKTSRKNFATWVWAVRLSKLTYKIRGRRRYIRKRYG